MYMFLKFVTLILLYKNTFGKAQCPEKCNCANITVDCAYSNLTLKYLRNLSILDLTNNSVTEVTSCAFLNMPKVSELILKMNDITLLQPGCFDPLDRLKILDLSYNKLKDVSPDVFKNLSYLETLDLSNNQIKNLSGNMRWLSLRKLDLSGNKLVTIDGSLFKSLPLLTFVNVSKNLLMQPLIFPNTTLPFILQTSMNRFNCLCNYVNPSIKCYTMINYIKLLTPAINGTICSICGNSTTNETLSQLQMHCKDDKSNELIITVACATGGGVFAGIIIAALVIVHKRKQKQKVNIATTELNVPQSKSNQSRMPFPQHRRKTFRKLQASIRNHIQASKANDVEGISIHQYYSISLNGSVRHVEHMVPHDGIYSTVHKNKQGNAKPNDSTSNLSNNYNEERETAGRASVDTVCTTISGASYTEHNLTNLTREGTYIFPSGQTIPDSRTVAKPIPKMGVEPKRPVALKPPNYLLHKTGANIQQSRGSYMDFRTNR